MEEVLVSFTRNAERIQKSRGAQLFSEGLAVENLYYVEEGFAKLFSLDSNGRETLYTIVSPGGVCGIALENGHAHSNYTASMITDGIVIEIPKRSLAKFCKEEPRAWRWLAEREAKQRASMERRIKILSIPEVIRRLDALIPYLIEDCGFLPEEDGSFVIPLLQSEVAGFVGATRETTSAMLNVMAKRNLIRLARGRVVIPDLSAFGQA